MENKETKTLELNANKNQNAIGLTQLSKDEVIDICRKQNEAITAMRRSIEEANNQIVQMNYQNIFARLNYLFKVVENKESFDTEFTSNCVAEIKDLMKLNRDEDGIEQRDTDRQ